MKKRFNLSFYICFAGIGMVLALVIKVLVMLFKNKIEMEDGPMSLPMRIFLIFAILIVSLNYFISFANMLIVLVRNKGSAFIMDESGIYNCLTFIIIFAFIFVRKVDFIPREALSNINRDGKYLKATVNTKIIKASPIAKLLIKINGFNFGANFVSPKVDYDEIISFVNIE